MNRGISGKRMASCNWHIVERKDFRETRICSAAHHHIVLGSIQMAPNTQWFIISPIAQVLFPVCFFRRVTISAFCCGEQRQHTTTGQLQASSMNSCS